MAKYQSGLLIQYKFSVFTMYCRLYTHLANRLFQEALTGCHNSRLLATTEHAHGYRVVSKVKHYYCMSEHSCNAL